MPQIEAYLHAIDQAERERNRTALITARAAQADVKTFKKLLKGFD
ncbi:hypothetical protein NUV66_06410 [Pseudomonas sp. 32.2.56]|nr:hypothetical protein [Pseudomonas sp. 32.2.56]MCR4508932.1 hypothetical protein [Pseudomonas sp. 32.2.56]